MRKLFHVTHRVSVPAIKRDDHYEFKPKERKGKRIEVARSFVDTFLLPTDSRFEPDPVTERKYRLVTSNVHLMPSGYYSWWAVDPSEWLQNLDPETEAKLGEVRPNGFYKNPPSSIFGSVAFSGGLLELLQCYQTSRWTAGEPKPDVYLLAAGTLRFQTQIGCVAIVCTEKDRNSEPLREYQPFCLHDCVANSDDPVLMLNDFVDENGKILFNFSGSSTPKFYPRYFSCDTWCILSFAFYYDRSDYTFKCEKEKINENGIDHNGSECLATYCRRYCPDTQN